jgi:hypothetical protein
MEISQAQLQERILANTSTVTVWASECVLKDPKAELSLIGEFYDDYSRFCRDRKSVALPRKAWLQAMKLGGFKTERGGFKGIRLREF